MAYDLRTLATLSSQARQFFTQAVPGAVARVWANTFVVFGKVFALLDFEHEMRRQWLFNQLFASTAEYEWLTRHGFELGLTPGPGDAAIGVITVAASPGLSATSEQSWARRQPRFLPPVCVSKARWRPADGVDLAFVDQGCTSEASAAAARQHGVILSAVKLP